MILPFEELMSVCNFQTQYLYLFNVSLDIANHLCENVTKSCLKQWYEIMLALTILYSTFEKNTRKHRNNGITVSESYKESM